jgi:hypothetical protein
MRLKELAFGAIVVILGHSLALIIMSYSRLLAVSLFIAINLSLIAFYILYLKGKLPADYYYDNNKNLPLYEKISIILGIIFLTLVLSRFTTPNTTLFKLIGRIGLFPYFIFTAGIIIYAFFMKIFSDMPMSKFKRYFGNYFRNLLIILSNIIWVSGLIYTYEVNYRGGVLHHKIVVDGCDEYATTFNDSLRMYQTKVRIRDSDPNMDYVIYYNHYPDNIHHIDTLMIENK